MNMLSDNEMSQLAPAEEGWIEFEFRLPAAG